MDDSLRQEQEADYPAVAEVLERAFGQKNEPVLVQKLRRRPEFVPELSLVAELDGRIVGHVLLFPVAIEGDGGTFQTLSLAPVSVVPEHQRKGIGGRLIEEAFKRAKDLGHSSAIVLGHAGYYPVFGFRPASVWDISAPFEVPDEAFMALELEKGALQDVSGTVRYPDEFLEV